MLDPAGQRERTGEVGNDGHHVDFRKSLLQLVGALLKIVARYVDGHIGRGLNCLEQDWSLGLRSGAEFDHHGRLGHMRGDFGHH